MTNTTKGTIAIILSAVAFSTMSIIVKLTGGRVSLFQQVFFRNLVMVIFSGILVKKNGESFLGKKENPKLLFFRSLLGYLGVLTSFYATRNLYLGDAQALLKISPFVVTILAVLFLKEKVTRTIVLSLVIAFSGALIIVNPKFDSRLLPSLIAVSSAVFSGGAYTVIGFISKKEHSESRITIVFLFALWSLIFSLPFVGNPFVGLDIKTIFLLFLIGVMAMTGQYLLTTAYSIADASKISIFDYVSPIISTFFGWVIFGETLSKTSFIGVFLILTAGYISFREARRHIERT